VNAVLDGPGGDGRPPKGSILLIEDDPITASVLRTIATELGWNADVVHSGRIGLQRLMTRDYAAVMLDVVLPDLDGYAILDALSRANPEMLSRVIIVTGLPEQYLSPMVESRVHSVVRKPIDAVQLTDELRRCASRFEPPIEAGGEIPTSL
jgi:CheY-like chemotaxis protein